jgi:hypothetical protein
MSNIKRIKSLRDTLLEININEVHPQELLGAIFAALVVLIDALLEVSYE